MELATETTKTPRSDLLYYLAEDRILLCIKCRAAVRPGISLNTHYRQVHKLTGNEFQRVISFASSVEARDPHQIELPQYRTDRIEQLRELRGYRCMVCEYTTVNRKNIISHCSKTGHAGSDKKWEAVILQSYSKGRHARYWIVGANPARPQEEERDQEADNEFQKMVEPTGAENVSIWIRETGWAVHLEGKKLHELHDASLMPNIATAKTWQMKQRAEKLQRLGESFDRVMQRCRKRLDLVPHETLRWLNSVDPSKPVGEPFRLKEAASTTYRYELLVKRYLVYCVRVGELGREGADEQHGIRFNDEQWRILTEIIEQVENGLNRSETEDRRRDDEEEEDDDEQQAEEEVAGAEEQDEEESRFDQLVFDFCIHSLKQKAKDYTGQLAGLVWCGRLMMLEHIFEDQPEDPEEVEVNMVERFKEEYRQWLADGSHTPFSTMIRWMAYGKGFRTKEGGAAKVMWDSDGEVLRYLGQRIEVQEFRKTVEAGLQETEALMEELTFGDWEHAKALIDLDRIVDSLMLEGTGKSFATDPRNAWLQPGYRFLLDRGRATLWKEREAGWRMDRVADYLRKARNFKLRLATDKHVWAGQPGRGPEMMTIRYHDTQQLIRNVFVIAGQVSIITDRDKSRAIRGLGRKVARFLPTRVGKMVVAYIAWLIPLERMLQAQTKIQEVPESLDAYMWKDAKCGAWGTEQLSEQLALLTGKGLGVPLKVSDYRHVAIALGRRIKEIVIRSAEVEMGDEHGQMDEMTGESREARKMEDVWDLQATHSSAMARAHYALDVQHPNQLSADMIRNFREISRLWHAFLEGKDGGEERSGRNERGVKETDMKREDTTTKRKRDEKNIPLTESDENQERPEQKKRRIEKETGDELQKGLERLLGNGASWRTVEQEQAMRKIVAKEAQESQDTLIVVLPTGGGKSVLFMLPSLIGTSGTSIVVVPFVALIDDLVDRAKEAGIDCMRWKSTAGEGLQGQQRLARLVIVSADVAVGSEFTMYVSGMRARKRLRRIFIDECHTIIMDVSYRRQLAHLKKLHQHDCQMILLTATLPPIMEPWFRKAMLAEQADIVRALTTKQNIRYQVIRMNTKTEIQDEVMRVAFRLRAAMSGDQKGVVYCRSHQACEEMAAKIGCNFYHAGIVDEGERKRRLQSWIDGKEGSGWIVATTALGTGIDIGGIVGIIHMEQPYGLVDFVQQTGRGGRRPGEVVESIIVMNRRPAWRDKHASNIEHMNQSAMDWFVDETECRRKTMGTFMDGVGMTCEEVAGELCDCCRGRTDASEVGDEDEEVGESHDGSSRLQEHVKEETRRLERLRRWLDEVEGYCAVCYVKWDQEGRQDHVMRLRHRIKNCPNMAKSEFVAWRQQVQFKEYTCCFSCGLPQIWCSELGTRRCEHMHKVFPIMMMASKEEAWGEVVAEEFQIDTRDTRRYREWLGRTRDMYGTSMTNGLAVWDLIVRRYCT
ncbi:Zinc finger, C2H2 [Lasallia pustulata]|uniref:DNA 3'-5' helicase n=1 Tax=Lasallia pustulata TaxID=136370 RepID=A0A1W5D2R3_9LECA|nr:Zinc finger, C2H2 [Lasallia pustulata]